MFEIKCADCGSDRFKLTQPVDLTAAQLLELVQAKLQQEAAERERMPLPTKQEMQQASGVSDVLHLVEETDRLQNTDWKLNDWRTPDHWRLWQSKVNVKCEVCGELISAGDECRWLPQLQAPGGVGLSMHTHCWSAAQQGDGLD